MLVLNLKKLIHINLTVTFLYKDENQNDNQGKELTANIQINEYTKPVITMDIQDGTLDKPDSIVEYGTSDSFTVTPNDGYFLENMNVNCNNGTENTIIDNVITIGPVYLNTTCHVTFTPAYNIHGYVVDQFDNPISNATVEIHSEPRTAITDVTGYFELDSIVIGDHDLNITKNSINVHSSTFKLQKNSTFNIADNVITATEPTEPIKIKVIVYDESSKQFERDNTYRLTFNSVNATPTSKLEIIPTGEDAEIDVSPKTGYEYTGIICTNGQEGIIENNKFILNNISNDTNCTVSYGAETYTLSMDSHSDEGILFKHVTYDEPYGTLPTISKDNYIFNGWYSEEVGGTLIDKDTIVNTASNHTIHAHYTAEKYAVIYNCTENGGTCGIPNQNVSYGSNVDLTKVASKEGYEFVGWNTDKDATIALSTLVMDTEGKTIYAIFKKIISISYKGNGASVTNQNDSCTIYNKTESCSFTSTNITRSGFNIIGFNTNKDASVSILDVNTTFTTTISKTYYAISNKQIDVSFDANGNTSVSKTSVQCNILNEATTCTIKSPIITPSPNTPNVIGFSTNRNDHVSSYNENTNKSFNTNASYYAQTYSEVLEKNVSYIKKDGVSAIGKESDSCSIASTYNGDNQAVSCTVEAPTITSKVGYGSGYFTLNEGNTTGIAPEDNITLANANTTYYAKANDIAKPSCEFSTLPYLGYNTTGNIVLTCTDNGSGINSQSLSNENFTISNTSYGEITNISSPVEVTNGYKYTITLRGKGLGTFKLTLKPSSIKDISNNGNDSTDTGNIVVSSLTLTPNSGIAYIGKGAITSNITGNGYGNLSCTSLDSTIATCSVSGTTLSVTGLNKGTTTITVNGSTGGLNATFNVTVKEVVSKPTTQNNCVSGLVYNGNAQTLTKSIPNSYTVSNNSKTNAGTYTITASLTTNYVWSDYSNEDVTFTCSISTATPEISITAKTATYNGNAISVNTPTVSGISGETPAGNKTITYYTNSSCTTETTTSAGATASGNAPIDAEQYYAKASIAANGNYSASSSSCVSLIINTKSVTVSWSGSTTFTYNGSNQKPTASGISGITGETINITNTGGINAGNYTSSATISSVTGGRAKASNYSLTKNTKTFTIDKANTTLTLSATTGSVNARSNITFTEKASVVGDFTNTSGTTSVATVSPASYADITANTEKTVTITGVSNGTTTITVNFTPNDTTNYNTSTQTYTVTGYKEATTGSCATLTYNGAAQTLASGGTGIAYSNNSGTNATSYTVTVTANSGYRFSDATTSKTLNCSISKKTATVTAKTNSRVYNGSAFTEDTCTATGLITGHTVTCAMTSDSIITNVGNTSNKIDTVTIKNSSSTVVTTNYSIIKVDGTLSVTAATPEISITAKTATYNGNAIGVNTPTVTPVSGGSAPTGTVSIKYYTNNTCTTETTTSTGAAASGNAPIDVGQYYAKASITANGNYTIASSSCVSLKINIKSVTVQWNLPTLTYNGSVQKPTPTVASGVTNETINLTNNGGTIAGSHTSTATISSVTGGRAKASNYSLTENTKTFTIDKANPTITLNATTGSVNAGSTTAFTEKSSIIGDFTNTSGTTSVATVSPASYADITANTEKTVTITGVSNGTSIITVSFTPNDTTNYNTVTKTYTVTGYKVASLGTCPTVTYNGTAQTLASGGTGVTYSNNSNTNATSYLVTARANSGYRFSDATLSKTLNCTITPKSATVTAASISRAYNGSALTSSTCTATGLISGHTIACVMTSGSTITAVGSVTNTINTITIKNTGNTVVTSNYSIERRTGTLTVTSGTITAGTVKISGVAKTASTLTATITANSTPTSNYSYQWWYSSSPTATSGTSISGATSSTYVLPVSMVGYYIGVTVTGKLTNYDNVTFSDITDATNNTYAKVVDNVAPAIEYSSTANPSYSRAQSVTVTIRDASGIKASQSVKYGWSTSTTSAPTNYTTVSLTNTAGATTSTFTATSSNLTGLYYLWVVPNTSVCDMYNNCNSTTSKTSGTFAVDNTAPEVSDIDARSNFQTSKVTITASDAHVGGLLSYAYAYVAGTSTCTSSLTYSTQSSNVVSQTLGTGEFKECLKVSDSLGNTTAIITAPVKMYINAYTYSGSYKDWQVPTSGYYRLEAWGGGRGARGAYTSGVTYLDANTHIYVYVGQESQFCENSYSGACNSSSGAAWNGGGGSSLHNQSNYSLRCEGGSGATDYRTYAGAWNNVTGLRERFMVAAGSSGRCGDYYSLDAPAGGGLTGYTTSQISYGTNGGGATQTGTGAGNAGGFGYGGTGSTNTGNYVNCNEGIGGGGGYYGGGGGASNGTTCGNPGSKAFGGGGSSFISGHSGCNAVNASGAHTGSPNHYKYVFTETLMIDGEGYRWDGYNKTLQLMPSSASYTATYLSKQGNLGNGYARMSFVKY